MSEEEVEMSEYEQMRAALRVGLQGIKRDSKCWSEQRIPNK